MTSELVADLTGRPAVHLWQRHLDLDAVRSEADLDILGDDERKRAQRFRRPIDRCRFVQRHRHLREVLATYLVIPAEEVPLDASLHLPPRLTGSDLASDLQISLSSSADRSIVAVAWRRKVGVDIEVIDPKIDVEALAGSAFSPREREVLTASPAEARQTLFFRIWTRKEAYVKALGTGFSRELQSFDVATESHLDRFGQPVTIIDREGLSGDPIWQVRDIAGPANFALACCAEGETWSPVFKENDG